MKLIKLTRNSTKWEIGKTVSIDKKLRRPKLYSDGVLHAYRSIEQALAMGSIYNYKGDKDLKIYEVEGDIEVEGLDKVGCYELTPTKELSLPDWYTDIELRLKILTRFTCYCALEIVNTFEDRYPNDDRPKKAIEEVLKHDIGKFNADAAYAAYIIVDAVYTTSHVVDHHIDVTALMQRAIKDFELN